jgi:DNA-binding XRE family transcriptional regulator
MKFFDSMKFTVTLKIWRNMNGFTSRDMADLSHIAHSTYGFIETGDRCPTIAELVNLSHTMGFEPTDFFQEDKKKK